MNACRGESVVKNNAQSILKKSWQKILYKGWTKILEYNCSIALLHCLKDSGIVIYIVWFDIMTITVNNTLLQISMYMRMYIK